jgi:phosphatidate cytidylyltransferase
MNNMLTRAIAGFVFIALFLFSILYSPESFLCAFFLFMQIALFEMSRMMGLKKRGIYLTAALLFATYSDVFPEFYKTLFEAATVFSISFLFLQELFSKKQNAIQELGHVFLALTYTTIPFLFLVQIPFSTGDYESSLIVGLFLLIWCNDSFAYLTGITIGKNKLCERISPKKTIEGCIGGTIATVGVAYLISYYSPIMSFMEWFGMAVIVSIFGVLGDLIASLFKRITGVKDTGKIIPGHGGIIDRLDSVIFIAPIVFIYLKIINTYVS